MVPLQNMGFEHPFDLAEALRTPRGVTLLMEQLFPRGCVSHGLEILPSRSDIFENNALLALQAELAQAMGNNPTVLWAYLFKACLLREVLYAKETTVDKPKYSDIKGYLALEAEYPLYLTAAHIAAMLWPDLSSASRAVRRTGTLRLYGRSLTKDAAKGVHAMYGMSLDEIKSTPKILESPEYQKDFGPMAQFAAIAQAAGLDVSKPMGAWINTPETLKNHILSWQKDFVALGIFELGKGSSNYPIFSIFPLLAFMGDLLASESLPDIAALVVKSNGIQRIPLYHESEHGGTTRYEEPEEDAVDSSSDGSKGSDSNAENEDKQLFMKQLYKWSEGVRKNLAPISAALLARIQHRFFTALEGIDEDLTVKKTFAGEYLHRCLVTFLNSILVEEFLHSEQREGGIKVTLENPRTNDKIFLENLIATNAIGHYQDEPENLSEQANFTATSKKEKTAVNKSNTPYPLFANVFSCPLWGMYLNPEETLKGTHATTVYGIYMRLQEKIHTKDTGNNVPLRELHKVTYGKVKTIPNLFPLLNSLAIPKTVMPSKTSNTVADTLRPTGTLTSEGVRVGLNPTPKQRQYTKIIRDVLVNEPSLLAEYTKATGPMPNNFSAICDKIIERYYVKSSEIDSLYRHEKAWKGFWNALKLLPKKP